MPILPRRALDGDPQIPHPVLASWCRLRLSPHENETWLACRRPSTCLVMEGDAPQPLQPLQPLAKRITNAGSDKGGRNTRATRLDCFFYIPPPLFLLSYMMFTVLPTVEVPQAFVLCVDTVLDSTRLSELQRRPCFNGTTFGSVRGQKDLRLCIVIMTKKTGQMNKVPHSSTRKKRCCFDVVYFVLYETVQGY